MSEQTHQHDQQNKSNDRALSPAAQELFSTLGTSISPDLFVEALTHRSFTNEHPLAHNYERLEFLGDAVLELVITETLYKNHPTYSEGQMSRIRSKVVSEESLSEIARDKLKISQFILLGIGEQRDKGAYKPSILCDVVESLIGAVFIEQGIDKARQVIHHLLDDNLAFYTTEGPALDWKTAIVIKAHKMNLGEVSYRMEMSGPENHLEFTAYLLINDQDVAWGRGSSKRKAQLDAAQKAWHQLDSKTESINDASLPDASLPDATLPVAEEE
ncbi:Ribonuclease III [Scardovia inopinata]|uniref:Ribonuclease 3 n=1 Tax=Scardovia inopinata F0304 TaxID=641146 RepID=W5IGZ3_SCAIO|nr:ribonuclease III [Scardovia inopinata]EFG26219.1 ribonuclease III [Scardovia inopinata F0304]BAR07151.1 ribonuclease III [Scardovia inopinata JCM 12537]SUV51222.1 Ribonuclease III [Scardovia inopinata]